MNYLILSHNKYHSNEKRNNSNNSNNKTDYNSFTSFNNLMDIENNNINIINNSFQKNKYYCESDKKTNIEKNINSSKIDCENEDYNNIINNKIFFENLKKTFNNKIKSNDAYSIYHTFKKPSKRNYLDSISSDVYKNNKENNCNNEIIYLNINENNYYYINNNKYNITSEEKYGIDFSKKKQLKKY